MKKNQIIELPEVLKNQLSNLPETGIGYHKVDLYLKNKQIIKEQVVMIRSVLMVERSLAINAADIEKIVVS